MATSPEVLASLNADLALEHGAIIQYVIHGLQLRDVGITDAVRKTAREEMWHFEWLVEAIADRGGVPTLERADVFLSASIGESMREDVATEGLALEHYARTLELVGDTDPELTHLLERIADDERSHQAEFAKLSAKVDADGEAAFVAHPMMGPEDIAVAGATIGLEYMTVLQYLLNKYGCGDCDRAESYFELAIDEMRHLSWAGSYMPGVVAVPQPPAVPTDRLHAIASVADAHAASKSVEAIAEEFYSAKVGEAKSSELATDLARAARQHEYHRYRLSRKD
jgi:bacterioferritin